MMDDNLNGEGQQAPLEGESEFASELVAGSGGGRKLNTSFVIMGVLDQYRRRGYDMYLIKKTIDNGLAMGFDGSDCSLIVENNTRMIEGLDAIGAKNYKTYRIYKKEI